MILRDYQSRLVSRAEKALDTFGNTLAVAATGGGKTVMLAALARKIDPGKAVVLQHRDELVSQNAKKFRAVNPDWRIGYFDAGTKSWAGRCTFAMVQTLHRNVDSMPALDLIIVDESHHVVSSTYRKILDRAKDINPDVMIAGFTATPARGDGKGMRSVFSNVCDMVTLDELVAAGFLVEPKCYVMTLAGVEDALKDVRRDKSGEYDMNEVEEVMNTTAHNKSVVREWKNVAGDRKTIVFCSTVEHSRTVCQEFERAGIKAAHIDGAMPAGARKATLQAFDHGPIQVLCNCAVLTEGWDCLDIETEVLTPLGWKKHNEINKGDKVFGFDMNNHTIESCDVQDKGERETRPDERMVEIVSQHMNIRVTEGHDLCVRKNRRGEYIKIKAGELPAFKSEYAIPVSGNSEFNPINLSDDEIRLIAWYITDGYLTKTNRLEVYQSESKHLEHIISLLDRLGIKHWHKPRKAKNNGYAQTAPIHVIGIGVRQTRNIFGYLDKLIHPYLMRMDKRQFVVFWNELLLGDGSRGKGKSGWLWTGRKDVADKIMGMAVVRGFHSSMAEEKTKTGVAYRVSVREKKHIGSRVGDSRSAVVKFSEKKGPETVWCVTNKFGTLITRRNGKVAIVGNCPPTSCVVLLRPCSYKSTMLQMVGRGLRTVDPELYPGVVKRDCLVLDFGASLKTHGDLSTQIRMDDREKMKQKCPECQGEIPMNVKECPLCGAVLREDSEGGRKEREIVDGKLIEFELLKKSPFRWIDLFGTTKVMFASGFNAWVSVVSPDGETWTAIGKLKGENVKKLAVAGRPQAIARADDFLRTYEESDAAKKSKRWMNDPATENQWRLLERFQYERDSLGLSMNKYQAACHMNFQFNRRAIEAAIL